MAANFPVPDTKGIGQRYWEGLKDRKFLVQSCEDCHRQIFYPRILCHHCGSTNVSYREHSGEGEIYSFTVVHRTRHPAFKEKVPYVVAIIDLAGGGRMMSNIIDCNPDDVKIGDRVKVTFTDITDSTTLPHFKLV